MPASDSRLNAVHPIASALRVIAVSLVAFYGVCSAAFVALHVAVGERIGLIGFLDNFAPLLLLPALPLLLACLVLRRGWVALALLPAALMFAWSYGAAFVPRQARATAGGESGSRGTTLRVLTYNLHAESQALAPMAAIIRDSNADVVALQELSPAAARAFASEFAQRYPYQALHDDPRYPLLGQGVLSRYPITRDEYWVKGLGQQRVTLDVSGTQVALYNVHPPHPFDFKADGLAFDPVWRSAAIEDILRRADADAQAGLLILAGDFNMTDQTDVYRLVTARLRDTYREVGWGMGFTFNPNARLLPLARIDYVFHDDRITSVAARVWPTSGGSDHSPVWVELVISKQ
jgi:vancomycin resistance protein VanJ